MAEVALKAEVRGGTGKGVARKLRATGKVPGTLYGRGIDPVTLAVDARELTHLIHDNGANVLIDLEVDSQTHLTLARALDRDPVRGTILHVDFLKIAHDQTIKIDVPIHIEGESHGVKEGGVLEHHLWQLHVECLPGNVPESITVDVTPLGIGEAFHVGDITPPHGVTVLTSVDEIIVGCVVPQVLKVEAELEEAAVPAEGAPEEAAPEGEAAEPTEAPSE